LTAGLRTENRTQELAYISRQLKALAKELHIAVIVVAQLNRDYDKRADKRPRMSDLEGSSQWEKDASVIVFIHRESQFVPEADVNRATLILAKARNGQIGDFPVGWNPRYSQFTPEPLVFGEADRRAHRLELLRQCEALPYTWADWQLEGDPKRLVTQVGQALASSHRLEEALLRELSALAKSRNGATPPVVTDFLAVGARAAVMQQAREQVAPALLEGRFAIFFGPSGRGKTLLARIVQRALILEHGMPAVWMNWRHTMREIKGTWNGNGREAEVWQQTHAPVLILDDPDKGTTEWSVGYLYDLLDQRMALTGGRQGPVLLVLNQLPKEFGEQLARHGHLGEATAQRGLQRGRPVLVDFGALPVWEERPGF
jgi:DNA replication protein DnaC